jgi:large subunit ribosomal protein L6
MSRIGKLPISLPAGVKLDVSATKLVTVKGPKGTLVQQLDPDMEVTIEGSEVKVDRPTNQKRHRALHGLSRSLVNNMVVGVTEGFTSTQELIGVGYRAANTGNRLELTLGYSHPIIFIVPEEVKVETKNDKGQPPTIVLSSIDKQLLGQIAAKIRALRAPEPYKGKGIRFKGEILRRKAGKTSGKGGKK